MGRVWIAWLSLSFCWLGGCYASSRHTGDGSTMDTGHGDPSGDPDAIEPAADIVDVRDVPLPQRCASSADCVVALHEGRCCHACPRAMMRAEMSEDPCLHELGSNFPFPVLSGPCQSECEVCAPCSDLPMYTALCVDGTCVPSYDGCDVPETGTPVPYLTGQDFQFTERWAPFAGRIVSVTGTFYPGPDSCACCTDCACDCFNNPVQPTIDCSIVLRGMACGQEWSCPGTECDRDCTPLEVQAPMGATGFLVPNETNMPELWVISWFVEWE